jgi:hypothetical protein
MIPPSEPGEPIEAEFPSNPPDFSAGMAEIPARERKNIRMGRHPGRQTPFSPGGAVFLAEKRRKQCWNGFTHCSTRSTHCFFAPNIRKKREHIVRRLPHYVPEEKHNVKIVFHIVREP